MAAATLVEELVEEILIRIPPDEPAHLVSAALVCKAWRRILSNHGFRRRYRKFHRTPPLLGYIQNYDADHAHARFLPTTTTTSPVSMAALNRTLGSSHWAALDCRHGRVLIYNYNPCDDLTPRIIVWDPITGSQQHLSVPPYLNSECYSDCIGSVLCATNGCDHLDCGSGPFAVVLVWTLMYQAGEDKATSACIYSSETGAWSSPSSININYCRFEKIPGVFIRDALYFTILASHGLRILKYDLYNHHGLSIINAPPHVTTATLVMEGDDQGLQLVTFSDDNCIDMWSSQQDTNGICGWVKHKPMYLPAHLLQHVSYMGEVIGFVEGTDMIFLGTTYNGVFTVNLKSRQARKIHKGWPCSILPYMSFYTPR